MRSLCSLFHLAALLLTASALPSSQSLPTDFAHSSPEQRSKYSKEAVIIERFTTRVAFDSNGTGTRESSASVRVQADAGVQNLAVLVFPYSSANQRVEVLYVRVRKPSGLVVVTASQNVQDMPAQVTRVAPMYSDLHEKHVPVKALNVGDVLEYAVRYKILKPEVPGQFWFEYSFIKSNIVLNEELEISVPAGKYVKVSSPDLKPLVTGAGSHRTYIWKTANLTADTHPQQRKGELPPASVQVTTFVSWNELARWYQTLQEHQEVVTPEIRLKANELTKDMVNADVKIRALYNFVSTQIHYVSLSFGIGRYQPHTAAEVLANGYGDCKDKHTLLAALLKSVGYGAWPALVNSSRIVDPDVPSPGQFDHVITVVPRETKMTWLDTTPEIAPFALLVPSLRDKHALVIPIESLTSASLLNTPKNPSVPNLDVITMQGKLDSNGTITAHVQHSASGDMEIPYRYTFRQYSQAQWDEMVQQRSWSGGSVRSVTASPVDNLDAPFEFEYDFSKNGYQISKGQLPFPFPPFNIESAINGDQRPTEPVYIGPPGETVYRESITLPTGFHGGLPAQTDIANNFADYHSRYSLKSNVLTAERRLVIKKTDLQVADWEQYVKFRNALRGDTSGIKNFKLPNTVLAIIFLSLLVLGLVAVAWGWRKRNFDFFTTPSAAVSPDPQLTGIGGWLVLLIVRLWYAVVANLMALERHPTRTVAAVSVIFAVVALAAALLMMVKSHYGVKIASAFLLLGASICFLGIWNAAVASNQRLFAYQSGCFVGSLLWWLYLLRSKRVRNTYFVADWMEPSWIPQTTAATASNAEKQE